MKLGEGSLLGSGRVVYKRSMAFIRALAAAEHPSVPLAPTTVASGVEAAEPGTPLEASAIPPIAPPPVPPGYQTPAPPEFPQPRAFQQPYATPAPGQGGFRPAPGGRSYQQPQQPTGHAPPQPSSYQPPPPPGSASGRQQASQVSWPNAVARVSQGIPGWVTALLIVGAVLAGVWVLASIGAVASPSGSTGSGHFGVLAIFLVASLAVVLASVLAVTAIVQGRTWARTMTVVAAIAMGLTGVGLVLAIPIGIGVARSR